MAQTHRGLAVPAMLRSMDAGLAASVLLGALLCLGNAFASGLYSGAQLTALGALGVVAVAGVIWPGSRGEGARHPVVFAGWQLVIAAAVLVAANRDFSAGQRLASDHLIPAAAAVTTFRGGWFAHVGMAALLALSGVFGTAVAGADQAITVWLYMIAFYLVMIAVARVLKINAARIEYHHARVLETEGAALVATAVRRDREQRARMLHDTVLGTLTAVAQGITTNRAGLRARCTTDLARLNRPTLLGELLDGADLAGQDVAAALHRVVDEAGGLGLTVRLDSTGAPDSPVPVMSADALVGTLSEALTNVRRHSGVLEAEVALRWAPAEITLVVRDAGHGFDTAAPTAGMGLRRSILSRARTAGGTARIRSEPGAGTTVEMAVPTGKPAPQGKPVLPV